MQQQGFKAYMTKPIDEAMLRHIIYEYCDFNHLVTPTAVTTLTNISKAEQSIKVIDWSLALQRSANNVELAKEMFTGLVDSLPEIQQTINEAMVEQNITLIKRVIHKLNGSCCYTGTPNLAKITNELETQLKAGLTIEELEPEFLEFFEHIEQVLFGVPQALKEINSAGNL